MQYGDHRAAIVEKIWIFPVELIGLPAVWCIMHCFQKKIIGKKKWVSGPAFQGDRTRDHLTDKRPIRNVKKNSQSVTIIS